MNTYPCIHFRMNREKPIHSQPSTAVDCTLRLIYTRHRNVYKRFFYINIRRRDEKIESEWEGKRMWNIISFKFNATNFQPWRNQSNKSFECRFFFALPVKPHGFLTMYGKYLFTFLSQYQRRRKMKRICLYKMRLLFAVIICFFNWNN